MASSGPKSPVKSRYEYIPSSSASTQQLIDAETELRNQRRRSRRRSEIDREGVAGLIAESFRGGMMGEWNFGTTV